MNFICYYLSLTLIEMRNEKKYLIVIRYCDNQSLISFGHIRNATQCEIFKKKKYQKKYIIFSQFTFSVTFGPFCAATKPTATKQRKTFICILNAGQIGLFFPPKINFNCKNKKKMKKKNRKDNNTIRLNSKLVTNDEEMQLIRFNWKKLKMKLT